MDVLYIILGILILLVIIIVYLYNRLIGMRNMVDTAYSNIDTLLQKRFDLVPNLVSTVKGYMIHERVLLKAVTKARSDWMNASTIQENAGADNIAAEALKSIFAVAENYPDLKANENFLLLQEELVGIENKIAYARQRYNRTVLDLNNAVQQFPSNLIAQLFRFQTREFFEVDSEQAREVPQVEINYGEN
ncbi:MAG TPA: LemA family protein [Methanobacterium sp.]|nr:MAG: LemA family protein [Methanobacterium sp.]HOI72450.1 LemA family protein [Methanobacterium sp.]